MDNTTPAISRLVEHLKGPAKVSQLLGGKPVYQEIQRWVARGWASPMHILALEPHLPPGMTIHDLYADRTRSRDAAPSVAAEQPPEAGQVAEAQAAVVASETSATQEASA